MEVGDQRVNNSAKDLPIMYKLKSLEKVSYLAIYGSKIGYFQMLSDCVGLPRMALRDVKVSMTTPR